MSLSLEDLRWKVSATERTVSGRNWRQGFGFCIQNYRGIPILSISYETENEAKEAESAVRKAVERAMDICTSAIR